MSVTVTYSLRSIPQSGVYVPKLIVSGEDKPLPELGARLADLVGLAQLAVLDKLSPAEHAAFVPLDVFDPPFDETALINGAHAGCRAVTREPRTQTSARGAETIPDSGISSKEIGQAINSAIKKSLMTK